MFLVVIGYVSLMCLGQSRSEIVRVRFTSVELAPEALVLRFIYIVVTRLEVGGVYFMNLCTRTSGGCCTFIPIFFHEALHPRCLCSAHGAVQAV